jgi:hypothetical protein
MVLLGMVDVKNAQSLLLVVSDQLIVIVKSQVDIAFKVILIGDLRVEHPSDDLYFNTGPDHELFQLITRQFEGECLIG